MAMFGRPKKQCVECGDWFKEEPGFSDGVGERFCSEYCSQEEYNRKVEESVAALMSSRGLTRSEAQLEYDRQWMEKMKQRGIFKD